MVAYMRQHGEKGQAAILIAVAMIGLLAIVGLALDGGMLYWNQRRAQNGADAAAIAGVTALVNQVLVDDYSAICGGVSEQPIIDLVNQYAANNEVPDAATGQNVDAFYLTQNAAGDYVDLINPVSGAPWQVGDTGAIPCTDISGLRVVASFPQDTFLAGVVGITDTNVTVEATAVYEYHFWCTDFAVFGISTDRNKQVLSITGAGTKITNGGMHSNGGMQIGGGGQGISLEPGRPVEYSTTGDTQIGCDKITGGPDSSAPCAGIAPVDNYPLPDDFFYEFEDFAPGGYIWNEVPSSQRFYYPSGIRNNEVEMADGTLRDGLYVTDGDIQLNSLDNLGDQDKPWRATFVARGDIKVSGGINQLPIARGIFAFSLSTNSSNGAIQLSGSTNKWAGLVAAPNGEVSFSGARNSDLSGMIIAQSVDISGSDNSINHRPEYCPANPPRVLLLS